MRGAIAAWDVLDERRALRLGTRRNTRRYKTRRGTRRDRGGGEDGGGMCSLSSSSLVRLYLIIDYSLRAYFHSFISSLISIPIIIQSISRFPPTPSCGFSLICGSWTYSPAPGRGMRGR